MKVLMWLSISLDRRTPSEHLLDAIVQELYKAGHTVHILQKVTGGDRPLLTDLMQQLGVKTICIPHKNIKKGNFAVRYLKDVLYAIKCKKALKSDLDYDCVFLQSSNVAGIQVEILRRIKPNTPITFNVQDIFPENAMYSQMLKPNGFLYRLLSALQRPAYQKADQVITISEDMQQELIRIGCPAEKITTVYNWSYQDTVYDPECTVSESVSNLLSPEYFNVVYAGNIGKMQNVDVIVHAAEILKNNNSIRFFIIGNGLYRRRLEEYARTNGLSNVVFHDMLDASDAPAIYCRADINIIPLAENIFRTALPSKTATCLACQKPIIFAMGNESIFGQTASQMTGAISIASDDAQVLSQAIVNLSEQKSFLFSSDWYRKSFTKSSNSLKYARIITKQDRASSL